MSKGIVAVAGLFVRPILGALILAAATLPAAAEDQPLPEPWRRMASSFSSNQTAQILQLDAQANANIAAAGKKIRADLTVLNQRAGTTETLEFDIANALRDVTRTTRIIENGTIRSILSPAQIVQAEAIWKGYRRTADISFFKNFAARQQNDLYCWAAAIQTLYNYNGIKIDQDKVADDIRGSAEPATVKPQDLATAVSNWHFDYKNPSRTWSAECVYNFISNPPPGEVVVQMIDINRQVLLSLGGQHAVTLHEVVFTGWWDKPTLEAVTVFDPLTGKDQPYAWNDLKKSLSGWWYCYVGRHTF